MTDLEMTKLCAEAMGLVLDPPPRGYENVVLVHEPTENTMFQQQVYDPIHDDAQAMALVKKFEINICFYEANFPSEFRPTIYVWGRLHGQLNRAIVECVAKMQAVKLDARKAAMT